MKKIFYAKTHADFLNQAFGTNYKAFMKTRYPYDEETWVWMVRLNGIEKFGFRNIIVSENEILEEYIFSDKAAYTNALERKYRIVVNIIDTSKGREYHILGKYKFDFEKSTNNKHFLRKIEEI